MSIAQHMVGTPRHTYLVIVRDPLEDDAARTISLEAPMSGNLPTFSDVVTFAGDLTGNMEPVAVWRITTSENGEPLFIINVTDGVQQKLAEAWDWEFDIDGDPVEQPPAFYAAKVTPWQTERAERREAARASVGGWF